MEGAQAHPDPGTHTPFLPPPPGTGPGALEVLGQDLPAAHLPPHSTLQEKTPQENPEQVRRDQPQPLHSVFEGPFSES